MLSVGRHPLAGLALGFAGVASAFNVNMIVKPLDAVLTELTNDAIHMVNPTLSIDLTANIWFSIASVLVLTVVIALITERIIEPRLGQISRGAIGRRNTPRAKVDAVRRRVARVEIRRSLRCWEWSSSSLC